MEFQLNIAALLEAAEYLERREREAEHGYASMIRPNSVDVKPEPRKTQSKRSPRGTSRTTPNSRSTHNELEKNRRAHLRGCLDDLKNLVPLEYNATRHTTLGLLLKSKSYIKSLEYQNRRLRAQGDAAHREQRHLTRKMIRLQTRLQRKGLFEVYKGSSESSSSSSFSSSSSYVSNSPEPFSSRNSPISFASDLDERDHGVGSFTQSESEDTISSNDGDQTYEWQEPPAYARPRPQARPSTRISISPSQLTLASMDI